MFAWSTNLNDVSALKNWDTSNVTDMSGMFYFCEKLTTVDVSHFDTSKVINMLNMFFFCKYI